MAIFNEIYDYLESVFPKTDSASWDCDGLDLCVDRKAEIKKIVLSLDVTSEIIKYAENEGANLIISHHPFLFDKINVIDAADTTGKKIISLIKKGISAISYHTRLDMHEGGVNDSITNALGLKREYKIFDDMINICTSEDSSFDSLIQKSKEVFSDGIKAYKNNDSVKKVAICGGGGKGVLHLLRKENVDTYITGELAHHELIDGEESGINLIIGTHYGTEALVLPFLKKIIEERFPEIPVLIKYTPQFSI